MCFFFSFCLLFKKTNKNTNQKNEKQKPQAKTKPLMVSALWQQVKR